APLPGFSSGRSARLGEEEVRDSLGRRSGVSLTSPPGSVVSSPGSMVRVLETARSMPSLSDRSPWLGLPAGVKDRALTPSRFNKAPAGMGVLDPRSVSGSSRRPSLSRKGASKEQCPPSSSSSGPVYPESQLQHPAGRHAGPGARVPLPVQPEAGMLLAVGRSSEVHSGRRRFRLGQRRGRHQAVGHEELDRLARFQNCPDEVLCTVVVSISQRWIVCVYPSVVQVYMGHSPNSMVLALPAAASATGSRPVRWASAAFSPTREVDHSHGSAGQDNYLAVLGTGHLRILDYATGWRLGMPGRTVSLMQDASPTCIVFTTDDGAWIICAFSSGQMQVWNASSLCLHKTVGAHRRLRHLPGPVAL
ncbi:unnamed protein product, partial [Prorocentrum cordatum]